MTVAPAAQARGWRSATSSLGIPQFRWLYASNMAFFFAMSGQGLVRSWLAFTMTNSELALGLIGAAVALPMLFIAPIGGVIADRMERRNLIAGGQAIVVISEVAILLLLVTDLLEFWHLLTASMLMGCVFPFIMPARQAIVMNIVGKQGLPNAMALNMGGMNASRVVGPASAGFLIGGLGIEGTYAIGLVLYITGLLCMLRVHRSRPTGDPRSIPIGTAMLDGLRYLRRQRQVAVLLLFGLVPMFLAMPFQTLLVVFARDVWDSGSSGLGILSAIAGTGGVLGSVMLAWQGYSHKRLRQMMLSLLGFVAFLFLFSLSPYFLLALPLIFIANIFGSIFSTLNNTAIQLIIPDSVRGRVSSFLMMSFSLPLLGTLPMSAVAEVYGARVAVAGASVLAMVVAIVFYALSPALRDLDAGVRKALEE